MKSFSNEPVILVKIRSVFRFYMRLITLAIIHLIFITNTLYSSEIFFDIGIKSNLNFIYESRNDFYIYKEQNYGNEKAIVFRKNEGYAPYLKLHFPHSTKKNQSIGIELNLNEKFSQYFNEKNIDGKMNISSIYTYFSGGILGKTTDSSRNLQIYVEIGPSIDQISGYYYDPLDCEETDSVNENNIKLICSRNELYEGLRLYIRSMFSIQYRLIKSYIPELFINFRTFFMTPSYQGTQYVRYPEQYEAILFTRF